jgi:hypothetical protein
MENGIIYPRGIHNLRGQSYGSMAQCGQQSTRAEIDLVGLLF